MINVVIVGCGISGLICAHVLKKYSVNIKIIEKNKIGGQYWQGGLKYIERSQNVYTLFKQLKIKPEENDYVKYFTKTGMLLKNKIIKYPKEFDKLAFSEQQYIKYAYYKKTRLREPDLQELKKDIFDLPNFRSKKAVKIDDGKLIDLLQKSIRESNIEIIKDEVINITYNSIYMKKNYIPYDYLVLTIPLWNIGRITYWDIPECTSIITNCIYVKSSSGKYVLWDYVYFPYTVDNTIYRLSSYGDDCCIEVSGDLTDKWVKLFSDLNFLFDGKWYLENIVQGLNGHLLPLNKKRLFENWPKNVSVLGKFAKWDSNTTLDITIDDAINLGKKWFGLEMV